MTTTVPAQPTTQDRIAMAAEHAFAQHGYESTRLADIAKSVGIRRPSLLYWFPTKAALYGHVVQSAFGSLEHALVSTLDQTGPFAQRIDGAALALHAFFDASPHVAALIVHELSRHEGPGQAILLERVIPLLQAMESRLAGPDGLTRAGLPVRSAILTVIGGLLLRHATTSDVRNALWGPHEASVTQTLARSVFLPKEDAP